MKKKILFVATSDVHINTFHLPYIEWLTQEGYEVHLAAENRGNLQIANIAKNFDIHFSRSPFSLSNFNAYKELKNIIESNNYYALHCHTPVPSAIARLAARKTKKHGLKVFYTAHGFHFYKGAPFKNWALFYPMEYLLSRFTDVIVTINKEDFSYIDEKMLHGNSYQIKGIGVNGKKFTERNGYEKIALRHKLNFKESDFILLYVAEFIPRKNHTFLLESLPKLTEKCPNLIYAFAGKGVLYDSMKDLSEKLGVSKNVKFLGFRNDVEDLAAIADIGISSSKHEGLGLGLAEEMLCGVPIVATEDKGHREMIIQGENGFLFEQGNQDQFVGYIEDIYKNPELHQSLSDNAKKTAKEFLIENSLESMIKIYKKHL